MPFGLGDGRGFCEQFRVHRVAGVLRLGKQVVYVSLAVGAVPLEGVTRQTWPPGYVIADSFSPGFSGHTRRVLTRAGLWEHSLNEAGCAATDGKIVLNTFRWTSAGADWYDGWCVPVPDPGELFEIGQDGIRGLGPAPSPEQRVSPDGQEYRFGDRVVRMASHFTMECATATGEARWRLNLRSYL